MSPTELRQVLHFSEARLTVGASRRDRGHPLRLGWDGREARGALAPDLVERLEGGVDLFRAVFRGPVEALYREAVAAAEAAPQTALRLRLWLRSPAVRPLPWEALHDPQLGPLALTQAILREGRADREPFLRLYPLDILAFFVGAPQETAGPAERLEESFGALPYLTDPRAVRTEVAGGEPGRLRGLLGGGQFDLLHLVLPEGERPPSARRLLPWLRRADVRLLVLQLPPGAPYQGLLEWGQRLVDRRRMAVVLFQIPPEAEVAFLGRFYRSLLHDRPLDLCLAEARLAVAGIHPPDAWIRVALLSSGGAEEAFRPSVVQRGLWTRSRMARSLAGRAAAEAWLARHVAEADGGVTAGIRGIESDGQALSSDAERLEAWAEPRPPEFYRSEEAAVESLLHLAADAPRVEEEAAGVGQRAAVAAAAVRPAERPPRYANVTFLEDDGQTERPYDRGLPIGNWYRLQVCVDLTPRGVPWTGERPPIEEAALPAGEAEILLVARSEDFEIEEPTGRLVLPPGAASPKPAMFRLRTSPERQLEPGDVAEIRLDLLYLGNLLQRILVEVELTNRRGETSSPRPVVARAVMGRSPDLEGFEALQPRRLTLTVSRRGDRYVLDATLPELAVGDGAGPGPVAVLHLERAGVLDAIREARLHLARLVRHPAYAAGQEPDRWTFEGHLEELARLGLKLYNRLFQPAGAPPGSSGALLGQWISRVVPEGAIVQVWVSDDAREFVYPWTLLYDRPVDERHPPDPAAFWGLRYAVEQFYGQPLVGEEDVLRVPEGARIVAGFFRSFPDSGEHEQELRRLEQESNQRVVSQLVEDPAQLTGLLKAWDGHILYFFCHGHTALAGEDAPLAREMSQAFIEWYDQATAQDRQRFKPIRDRLLPQEPKANVTEIILSQGALSLDNLVLDQTLRLDNHPLVVLNMCDSAVFYPSLRDGFVPFFVQRGARGVIGTECPMTSAFAHRLGSRLIRRLCQGDPVGRIFLDLRREFLAERNPLGLAYSLFVDATTRLDPALLPKAAPARAGRQTGAGGDRPSGLTL